MNKIVSPTKTKRLEGDSDAENNVWAMSSDFGYGASWQNSLDSSPELKTKF